MSQPSISSLRLEKLRAFLTHQGMDGFVIPTNDEFLGEYVPDSARRLQWLTGFTGSAGAVVVLLQEAAFFTDGRYVLQAEQEVEKGLYQQHNSADRKLSDWIAGHIKPGQKIAYDPWLHTEGFVEQLEKAAASAGASCVACRDNPIDILWEGRPSIPLSPVMLQEEAYAGEGREERIQRISKMLQEKSADALLLAAPDSICWLLNIRGHDVPYTPFVLSFAAVSAEGKVDFYCHKNKLTPAIEAALSPFVSCISIEEMPLFLQALKGKKIQLDPQMTPVWFIQQLQAMEAAIIYAPDPCQLAKACKNSMELAGMQSCHKRDGAAVTEFLYALERQIQTGKKLTEVEAAEQLVHYRKKQALFVMPSFATIAGFGAHGAIVHYHAREENAAEIKPHGLFLLDSGGQYLDGTTDITRTIAIGTPTAEQKERFTQVLKGHITLATARFPEGTTGSQLDALARYALWQLGLDYDHGTGHGVGCYLSVHEGPQRISKAPNNVPLKPGMIISNEPGYYKAGEYGIRIESLVAVVPSTVKGETRPFLEFETLTRAPIDKRLVEEALLTASEKAWLNHYHRQVYHDLEPFFKEREILEWLKEATEPI